MPTWTAPERKVEDMSLPEAAEHVWTIARSAGLTKQEALKRIKEAIDDWACGYADGVAEAIAQEKLAANSSPQQ